jgi:endonuclease-3 related protein
MKKPAPPDEIFSTLFEAYGKQGWWPVFSRRGETGFDDRGYHRDDDRIPVSDSDRWEVALGAILTQNTAWPNVERALLGLSEQGLDSPRKILTVPADTLAGAIRPSGYFNQKARRVQAFASFFLSLEGAIPARDNLLGLSGIGPETADSMLLYAWHRKEFVVDAYTVRILRRLGHSDESLSLANPSKRYEGVKYFITSRLNPVSSVNDYKEIHALFVCHAKEHCRARPVCDTCPLANGCAKMI